MCHTVNMSLNTVLLISGWIFVLYLVPVTKAAGLLWTGVAQCSSHDSVMGENVPDTGLSCVLLHWILHHLCKRSSTDQTERVCSFCSLFSVLQSWFLLFLYWRGRLMWEWQTERETVKMYQCLRMHFVLLSHPSCYNMFLIELRSFHHTRHTFIFLLHYITSNVEASLGFENFILWN